MTTLHGIDDGELDFCEGKGCGTCKKCGTHTVIWETDS